MKQDVAHGTVVHSLLWLPLDLVAYESPLTVQSKQGVTFEKCSHIHYDGNKCSESIDIAGMQ
jgi:hypothetical protein